VRNPAYATAVGLVMYAHRQVKSSDEPSPNGWLNRLQAVVKRYF
jgi:DNA-binding IclR family transcriptional regulator